MQPTGASLQFTLDRLAEGPEQTGWWLHFVVLGRGTAGRTLIGSAGYKGPPCHARAFALPAVHRVIAETLPELTPSIGVLRKCGFRLIGDGSEPGVIRFELTRSEYSAQGTA